MRPCAQSPDTSSPREKTNGTRAGATIVFPAMATPVAPLLPRLMHQWSTGLRRIRAFVRIIRIGGVETRLTPKPPSIQAVILAGKPSTGGCGDAASKTEACQRDQASNCSEADNACVANVAKVMGHPLIDTLRTKQAAQRTVR